MKRIIALFLLSCFLVSGFSVEAFAKEKMPDLPDLPPEFDTVLPPDGMDVFSPSTTPAQEAPKVIGSSAQNTKQTTTSTKTISKQQPQTQLKPDVSTSAKPTTTSSAQKTPSSTTTQNKPVQKINNSTNSYYKNNTKTTYTVPKGKKFKVRLQQNISSSTPVGTRITFVSRYPETSTYITIPAGTVFKGKITDSHRPQYTGNGGLIVINVDQMIYNGKTYEIDAKISIANEKRIFFNNIKGKRMYFQSIPKAITLGSNYFKKMWKVTKKLAKNESGVEIILTPFSFIAGTVVYVVNIVASPVLAIFYKGKSITIQKDAPFIIKLREDAIINK